MFKKKKKKKKIVWFARGAGIMKAGPFKTQIEAVNAMRLREETAEEYATATWAGNRKRLKGGFPDNVFVWPEEVNDA